MHRVPNCPLCEADGGELVWMGDRARLILVEHDRHPGFCRIVWNDHVAELSDLDEADQAWLMRLVTRVERVVRDLPSLGVRVAGITKSPILGGETRGKKRGNAEWLVALARA